MAKYSFDALESIPSGFLTKFITIIGTSKQELAQKGLKSRGKLW